jgi:hypothetical protein
VPEKLPDGVGAKFIFGSDLKDNEGSNVIFVALLPKALEKGKLITASNSQVVEKSLDCIQAGLDLQKKSKSAKKMVDPLWDAEMYESVLVDAVEEC